MNTLFVDLTWWQTALLGVYALYTLIRAFWIFQDGFKGAMFGSYNETEVKLYHMIWIIIDIPAMLLGKLFPLLKRLFNIKVFTLKEKKDSSHERV